LQHYLDVKEVLMKKTLFPLVLLAIVAPVSAQSVPDSISPVPRHAPFAQASMLIDSDYAAGGGEGLSLTVGGSIEAGVPLRGRHAVRVEMQIPRRHSADDLAGSWTSRTVSYSFLLAENYRELHRVGLSLVVGLSVMKTAEARSRANPGWEWVPSDGSDTWLAPTIGFDLPIAVSPHVAIVPQWRYHSSLLGIIADPDGSSRDLNRLLTGVRWQF
jgi:hypothetical protein